MFHAKDNLLPTLKASSLTLNSVRWLTDGDRYLSFSRSELNSSFAS